LALKGLIWKISTKKQLLNVVNLAQQHS